MRPSKDRDFMASAFNYAFRSHDLQSKVGAVIVNRDQREVGRGRNGFPSNIKKEGLPTTRPNKYPFMVHAEINALANMTIKPEVASLYVTRMPCVNCAKALWQNNIREWNVPTSCMDFSATKPVAKFYNEEDTALFDVLISNGLIVNFHNFNMDDLSELVESNKQYFNYLS
jgi:deoxycytidylate deaminase